MSIKLAFILFGRVILSPFNGEHFLQVRTQKMPYLTNAEENELKRLKTTTGEGVLRDEELLAAKGTRSSSIGYWGGERVVGFGFTFVFFEAIVAHSFPSNYWIVQCRNEHIEQARAPHTSGPRDVPRCGALSLLQKPLHYRAGGKKNWYCRVNVTELARCVGAAARRELRGGNCAARFARRDLRGAHLRGSCAARFNSNLGLN
jgi:hypothetical protein